MISTHSWAIPNNKVILSHYGLMKYTYRSRVASVFLFIVFAIGMTNAVWGQGFRNPPSSPSSVGRVGGNIAQIDDVSAVDLNPANLVDLQNSSFMAAITLLYADVTFHSANGETLMSRRPLKALPDFFAAMPLADGKYTVGLGVTTPFGTSSAWGENSIFRYTMPWYSELDVVNINPTFATKLTENLSIGVGVDVFLSQLDQRQFYPWSSLTGNPTSSDGDARFIAQGTGIGENIALTWKVAEHQRLAVTYRTPVDVEYSGNLHLTNVPSPSSMPAAFSGVTSATPYYTGIEFPAELTLGYGVELTDKVRLETDVKWIEFSTLRNIRTEINNDDVLLASTSTRYAWKDIWTFGLGGDWKFAKDWILRSGYQYLPSPISDQTYTPLVPDADRHMFSIGLGHTCKHHSFELAYADNIYANRTINNDQNAAYNGTWKMSVHLLSLSYKYSF